MTHSKTKKPVILDPVIVTTTRTLGILGTAGIESFRESLANKDPLTVTLLDSAAATAYSFLIHWDLSTQLKSNDEVVVTEEVIQEG